MMHLVPPREALFLPCHLDGVSLQTHGHSLSSKVPTVHPVCSVDTDIRTLLWQTSASFYWQKTWSGSWLSTPKTPALVTDQYYPISASISKCQDEIVSVHCELSLHSFKHSKYFEDKSRKCSCFSSQKCWLCSRTPRRSVQQESGFY